jgi:hypothetical protein
MDHGMSLICHFADRPLRHSFEAAHVPRQPHPSDAFDIGSGLDCATDQGHAKHRRARVVE